jgi:hypothetical protein
MKIGKLHLQKPRTIWNIDGTHNKAGTIKDFVDLQVRVGPKIEEMKFLVTDLGEDEIVLGYPWLAAFQPKINWKEATITEDMQPIVIKTLGLKMDKEVTRIAKAWTEFVASTTEPSEEIFIARIEGEILNRASTSTEFAVKQRRKPGTKLSLCNTTSGERFSQKKNRIVSQSTSHGI